MFNQEIISPKNEEPHGTLKTHETPLHVLQNPRDPRNPC